MTNIVEKEWIIEFTDNDRMRVKFKKESAKGITELVVQLESNFGHNWEPIVRYDTAHGFLHRDTYAGETKKEEFTFDSLSETLSFAQKDLTSNWPNYKFAYVQKNKPR